MAPFVQSDRVDVFIPSGEPPTAIAQTDHSSGEGQAPAFGTLRDLLDAPGLTATLTLDTGDTATTTWPMEGAAKPVAQALGIPMGGIPAGEAWEEAASQAMLAAMTACQFPGLDVICVQKVSACSTKISEARDIDAFDICVADGG